MRIELRWVALFLALATGLALPPGDCGGRPDTGQGGSSGTQPVPGPDGTQGPSTSASAANWFVLEGMLTDHYDENDEEQKKKDRDKAEEERQLAAEWNRVASDILQQNVGR